MQPQYRGQGIGKAFFANVAAIARERGWTAPSSDTSGTADGAPKESDDRVAEQASVEESSSTDETAAEKDEAK